MRGYPVATRALAACFVLGASLAATAGCVGERAALAPAPEQDPLPSWNDTAAKAAITAFVERVTQAGTTDFVPVPERIAVFDNDGTLWPEAPVPFQAAFVFD